MDTSEMIMMLYKLMLFLIVASIPIAIIIFICKRIIMSLIRAAQTITK